MKKILLCIEWLFVFILLQILRSLTQPIKMATLSALLCLVALLLRDIYLLGLSELVMLWTIAVRLLIIKKYKS